MFLESAHLLHLRELFGQYFLDLISIDVLMMSENINVYSDRNRIHTDLRERRNVFKFFHLHFTVGLGTKQLQSGLHYDSL